MLKQPRSLIFAFAAGFVIAMTTPALGKTPSAAQLLKQGSSYQAADDTTDRAADIYRQLIRLFPKSTEAEAAQFFLGTYYARKFFILEQRSKTQDWEALNRAEEELFKYKGKYSSGFYISDAFHLLATIAMRRGYTKNALTYLQAMKQTARIDTKVYIFRMTWSPNTSDVVKRYCDTGALADTSLQLINKKLAFDSAMSDVTNWARGNCKP